MEKIEIGKIVKPQGVKGDVKVVLFADDDFNLSNVTDIYIEDMLCKIEKVYNLSDGCYGVKFNVITSRNSAEEYRGKLLYLNKDIITAKQGRYFIADLLNKKVVLDDGTVVGKITDIQNFGSADVIYIKGAKQVLCSHLDGLIAEVNDTTVTFVKSVFNKGAIYED